MGARITVADTRPHPPERDALRDLVPEAVFVHSSFDQTLHQFGPFSRILKSPGIAPADAQAVLCPEVPELTSYGGEVELFVEALAELSRSESYLPKVLAITGTNGKTTVTSLTGKMVERAGKTVAVAGNIGPTLLTTLMEKADAQAMPEVWVLELSSFQLQGVENFQPTAAALLNVSEDHLDWHGSMTTYVNAKKRIFGSLGRRILNRDDPVSIACRPQSTSNSKSSLKDVAAVQTFGKDLPTEPGDYGIETTNGMSWLVRAMDSDGQKRKRSEIAEQIHLQRLMPVDALRIKGRHNMMNALAALALGEAAGCPLAPMLFGLREYRGEPHRVEFIGRIQGIDFVDDSKGTNVGATAAALYGLGADQQLVAILGGVGKGQDFTPLAKPIADHARAVVLIGRDGALIADALGPLDIPVRYASSMAQAVKVGLDLGQSGDAVLLSPACASFDMFENYVHRAEVFRESVEQLALESGNTLEGAM